MSIKLPPPPAPWVSAGEFYHDTPDFYVIEQLHTAQREAALAALEEAAKVCENFNPEHQDCNYYDRLMAEAIRALRTELEKQ